MYAHVILSTLRRAPLFAVPRLRRLASDALDAHRADLPCTLWAYAVQPCAVRLVIGPAQRDTVDDCMGRVKAWLTAPVLEAIARADDDTLDAVLHYNPVWGGAIYRLWDAGYHYVPLWNAYRLDRALGVLNKLRQQGAVVWIRRS